MIVRGLDSGGSRTLRPSSPADTNAKVRVTATTFVKLTVIRHSERTIIEYLSRISNVFCFPKDQIQTKHMALPVVVSRGYVNIYCETSLLTVVFFSRFFPASS
jgi:hypothetical protein